LARCGLEGPQFSGGERTPLTWFQTSIGKRTNTRAHKPDDRMTDGVAHPPDLTVPTLVNRQSDHPRSEKRCFSRSSESILEFDPLPKPPEFGPSGRAFEVRDVFLLDAIGRMGQSMREGAIVGEEKKSFCIHVEATHREDAWFDGYQFDDRGATLRIVSRCNDPSRLVQQVVHESGFDTDRHAVDFDIIGIRIDATSEIGNRSVHGDTAISDQVFTDATASDTNSCENLLQSLAVI